MYDLFLSYRRDGGFATARLLYEHLKSIGLNPFFDLEELRSGPFNTKLYTNIEESSNFIPVLSKNALDRCTNEGDWLRLEIAHAIKNGKNIVPVMLEEFQWPDTLPNDIKDGYFYICKRDEIEAEAERIANKAGFKDVKVKRKFYNTKTVHYTAFFYERFYFLDYWNIDIFVI